MNTDNVQARVEVTLMFPISEKHRIMVHLKSYDWDYRGHMQVRLRQGELELRAMQIGYGSVKRDLVIALTPVPEWPQAMATLEEMRARPQTPIYLETVTPVRES